MKKYNSIYLIVTLLVIVQFSSMMNIPTVHPTSSIYSPTWLKHGAYVEYVFGNGVVQFYNSSNKLGFDFIVFSDAYFKWECIELNETSTKIRIKLSLTETSTNGNESGINSTSDITTDVIINLNNRGVYLSNGTLIGTTHLWLPSNPIPGDNIVLWDVPPYEVILKISDVISFAPETPQGSQKVFKIEGSGSTGGVKSVFTVLSDFDTGILIDGGLNNEGTMRALNIRDFSHNGRMFMNDTNINLGPDDTSLDVIAIFSALAIPIASVIIFIGIYRKRKK
ncbi:MAG: hypothetical protein JW702_11205 [Clostridiales bacterium]|nr:hypothetical protein [Clostridiales bacterium]